MIIAVKASDNAQASRGKPKKKERESMPSVANPKCPLVPYYSNVPARFTQAPNNHEGEVVIKNVSWDVDGHDLLRPTNPADLCSTGK